MTRATKCKKIMKPSVSTGKPTAQTIDAKHCTLVVNNIVQKSAVASVLAVMVRRTCVDRLKLIYLAMYVIVVVYCSRLPVRGDRGNRWGAAVALTRQQVDCTSPSLRYF